MLALPVRQFIESRPEKHEKFTQSKFDIFFLHKSFSGFYKNVHRFEKMYTNMVAGLHVFPGLIESIILNNG